MPSAETLLISAKHQHVNIVCKYRSNDARNKQLMHKPVYRRRDYAQVRYGVNGRNIKNKICACYPEEYHK